MTRARRVMAATTLLTLALTSCRGGDPAPPQVEPSDSLSAPQQRLAELAGLAAAASYDVTYALTAASGDKGTIRIVAAPPSYRVDVTLGGEPATFIQRDGTVTSCTRKAGRASCFLVARPGEPVPDLFDPGVQRLFSDAVAELATHPDDYAVESIPAESAPPADQGECFDVRRVAASTSASTAPAADPTGFETGQYCFGPDGVLTRLDVTTGTLTLESRGAAPTESLFVPPATPVALPDLPSASPRS
ncbi:MAG TPA: hypothetical protein VNA14_04935 [Mycobacteriales bacterium]|nr:hypothetical protein [Mycobacteriales bacterium]